MRKINYFKIIGFSIVFIVLIFFDKYLLLLIPYDKESDPNYVRNKEEFEGKILSKYIDFQNHSNRTFKIIDTTDKTKDCMILIQKLYDDADSGDFVIKRKGTRKYLLVKHNIDTLSYTYLYE